jgi:aspartyl-tRNA(Asn)/glutamyl-tRNA(Gln) amidotransferase subunit A
MSKELLELSAWMVAEKISNQEIKAEEYVSITLDRIGKVEPKIHSFISILGESILDKASKLDKKISRGEKVGKLVGLPIAVKDNICVKGVATTCASRMLEKFIAPYNATVVKRIVDEDGLIIGKTNLDEFAMGTSTEYSYFGPSRNPWDISKVPGGSSGGSASSVAGFESALSLGSDTGGSVRSPASFCSVVGLKPTYGAVSRYGLISYSNSLEQIGPFSRDVRSCALLMDCINGYDKMDATSIRRNVNQFFVSIEDDIGKIRIGVPKEFFGEGVMRAVSDKVWNIIHELESLGMDYEETTLPMIKYALPAYYIIAMSEASSNLARYDGLRYGFRVSDRTLNWNEIFSKNRSIGFGEEVKRRIMLGTYALSAGYFDQYYLKAQKIRTLLKKDFDNAFRKFDILVSPSMPILPFELGEKMKNPLELYMCDVNTVPSNLVGIPSISIPCGLVQGLPVGLQIMAPHFREDILFRLGKIIEDNISIDRTKGEFTYV